MIQDIDTPEIYTRLLAITFDVDPKPIPDPSYINQKIGECNRLIDEVEKIAIRISRVLSTLQRALNNAISRYESAKETILTEDETVKKQPNIRDREALANQKLKAERDDIRMYQNDVTEMNNLLRAANLKLKNLNRSNADIKMQVRMMESQLKLGTPIATDAAARSLVAELRKGISSDDLLVDAETTVEEPQILDPTEPIDPKLLDPDPEPGNNIEESAGDDCSLSLSESLGELSEETVKAVEAQLDEPTVDLDQIIDVAIIAIPLIQGGESPKEPVKKEPEKPAPSQNAGSKQKVIEGGVDIDSLLSQFA